MVKILGSGKLEAMRLDTNTAQLCHIRGVLHKTEWINVDDIVLINLRDYQDEVADVVLKYSAYEVEELKLKQALYTIFFVLIR